MSAENTPQSTCSCKPKVLLVLGGLGLLAAGVILGHTVCRPAHPPMPMNPQARFGPQDRQGPGMMGRGERGPDRREARRAERGGPGAEMRGEIQKWAEPIGKIREKYRGEIAKILRPEQKAKLDQAAEQRDERRGPGGPGDLIGVVLIAPQADRIATMLVLDDAQKKQVTAILKKQRDEVLAWVDSNPPPKMEGRPHRTAEMEEPSMNGELAEGFAAFLPERPGFPE